MFVVYCIGTPLRNTICPYKREFFELFSCTYSVPNGHLFWYVSTVTYELEIIVSRLYVHFSFFIAKKVCSVGSFSAILLRNDSNSPTVHSTLKVRLLETFSTTKTPFYSIFSPKFAKFSRIFFFSASTILSYYIDRMNKQTAVVLTRARKCRLFHFVRVRIGVHFNFQTLWNGRHFIIRTLPRRNTAPKKPGKQIVKKNFSQEFFRNYIDRGI